VNCPIKAVSLSAGLAALVRAQLAEGSCASVRSLARRAGLSQPLVANWLAGRRGLSLDSLDAVRVAVGVGWCDVAGCRGSCAIERGAAVVSIERLCAVAA
jgi:transcriptional regulator with XRE-family HTH domain